MKTQELVQQIREKRSFLCVGLDTNLTKIPAHLQSQPDALFAFNKAIIDATAPYCVAYKPNLAFYEAYGLAGWKALEQTMDYLNTNYPSHFTIADAKRGDIGNTAKMYAQCFFEQFGFDSVTVAPYMGKDSVEPFLEFTDKHTIVLALTSNAGAHDFQSQPLENGNTLYQEVIAKTQTYQNADQLMYVVGATQASYIAAIREQVPHSFFLVPGVGAQGGDLQAVAQAGLNAQCGILINSSRGILYAGQGEDFAEKAAAEAQAIQREMQAILAAHPATQNL